jgi:hypothetical protein
MTPQHAPYEIQIQRLARAGRIYPVRVTPIPPGTWCLQAQTHDFRPYLLYWAMATVQDIRNPDGRSTWTLWFGFQGPPMEHLDKAHHDGLVGFPAEQMAPNDLVVPGFAFELFVGPGGTIAKGLILESPDGVASA